MYFFVGATLSPRATTGIGEGGDSGDSNEGNKGDDDNERCMNNGGALYSLPCLRDLNFAKVDQFCERRLAKLRTQKNIRAQFWREANFQGGSHG